MVCILQAVTAKFIVGGHVCFLQIQRERSWHIMSVYYRQFTVYNPFSRLISRSCCIMSYCITGRDSPRGEVPGGSRDRKQTTSRRWSAHYPYVRRQITLRRLLHILPGHGQTHILSR